MKKFIIFALIFLCFAGKTYATENIITTFSINNEEESDIEIVINKNKIYLPCKFLLTYFKIPFKENHAQKTLTFFNSTIKQGNETFFIKNCLTGAQNEFFIPTETFNKLTGKNITANNKDLTVYVTTTTPIETKSEISGNPFLEHKFVNQAKAHPDEISLPQNRKFISLDTVSLQENMYSDSYSQIYKENTSKFASFNNNLQLLLNGRLKSGEYSLDFGTNSYTSNIFNFSGISPKYKNKFKNYDYVLGKTEPWEFAHNNLSSDIIGIQIKSHTNKNENDFKAIEGKVDKNSIVEICLNNDFKEIISTYGGYFNLKNINYNKFVNNITINEIKQDGTKQKFLKKNFYNTSEIPSPNRDFILGINGLQNRLWASNGYIYRTN